MSDEGTANEPVYLICAPVAWQAIEDVNVIPGSKEHECEECGQPISVAPSGQMILASNADAHAVCVPCGQEHLAKEGTEPDMPTDEQMKELKDALLRERL